MSAELVPELLEALRASVPQNSVVLTLSNQRRNRVVDIKPAGITVETERSKSLGREPELVPAWMIQVAWDHLRSHGRLSNRELLSTEGLNVKRSSAVCALLAQLPDVQVVSRRPIVLQLRRGNEGG